MAEQFTGKVIAMYPQDQELIKHYNLGMRKPWSPSITDSPTVCDSCGRDCWIGQQQKTFVDSPLMAVRKLCLACVSLTVTTLGLGVRPINVNIDADKIQRRKGHWS